MTFPLFLIFRRMRFIKNCDIWQTPAPPEQILSKLACVTNKMIWEIEEAKRFCARLAMKSRGRCECRTVQFNSLSGPGQDESDWDDDDDNDALEVCQDCYPRKRLTIPLELGGNTAINRNLMTNQVSHLLLTETICPHQSRAKASQNVKIKMINTLEDLISCV